MPDSIEFLLWSVLIGIGASAMMDAWALLLRRAFKVPTLDYALLGRWIGHFPRGQFFHERIAASDPVPGERPLGWIAHYSIGIAFAGVLLTLWGLDWARSPTLWPALLVGVVTIVGPWFVMQPGMGAGVAASRAPNPRAVRLRNLATHLVFGVGLFLAALALSRI
jgi:hypothetical protein